MDEQNIDMPEFLDRVQNDYDLILELLDIFSQDYIVKRSHLTEAIANKDCEQVKSLSHSLKGASGNISAKRLRVSFLKLEEMAKQNDFSTADSVLKDLDRDFKDFLQEVTKIKSEKKK